jgi:hypothetical protein
VDENIDVIKREEIRRGKTIYMESDEVSNG